MENPYDAIAENIKRVRGDIGEAISLRGGAEPVRLMAVTKTVPPQTVNAAISMGIDLLGENRAQELLSKYDIYDKERAEIHFIGYLQSNKVRQIIEKVSMIQSVDRLSVACEINAQAEKTCRVMDILVEVNIGGEDSKSGVSPEMLEDLLWKLAPLPFVRVRGLMTIPPFSSNILQTERYFYAMRQLYVDIGAKNIDNVCMEILSMGMSGDYACAIKHGSSLVRVGSAIFGSRG